MNAITRIAKEHRLGLEAFGASTRPGYLAGGGVLVVSAALQLFASSSIDLQSTPTSLIAVAGIMAALLFGLQATLYEKAMDAEESETQSSERARRLESIAAHAAFESVLAFAILTTVVVAEILQPTLWLSKSLVVLALGMTGTFVSTAILVAERVMVDTLDRLRSSRTGRKQHR